MGFYISIGINNKRLNLFLQKQVKKLKRGKIQSRIEMEKFEVFLRRLNCKVFII